MSESDWQEALSALGGESMPGDRHALVSIVRDEIDRLQRELARSQEATRLASAAPRKREPLVRVIWSRRRVAIAVAPYDAEWLAQLFLDSMGEPKWLRLARRGDVFGVGEVAPGTEPGANEVVVVECRGLRMFDDRLSAEFEFSSMRGDHFLANTLRPLVADVDVSTTVPVAPVWTEARASEVCSSCGRTFGEHPFTEDRQVGGVTLALLCDGRLIRAIV